MNGYFRIYSLAAALVLGLSSVALAEFLPADFDSPKYGGDEGEVRRRRPQPEEKAQPHPLDRLGEARRFDHGGRRRGSGAG